MQNYPTMYMSQRLTQHGTWDDFLNAYINHVYV